MKNRTFYLLCIGELLVIIAGEVGLFAAAFIQILLIAHLFRSVSFSSRIETKIFLTVFLIPSAILFVLIFSFHHTLIPLILLAIVAAIAILAHQVADYHLQRSFGGVS
jgi:uncharacterized protein YqgC (DUF456 family)